MKKLILLLLSLITLQAYAELTPKDFESTVGLILQKKEFKTVCSGVLIEPNVVMTAAHCLTDLVSVRVINNYQITRLEYIGVRGKKIWGTKWLQHPSYNGVAPGSIDLGLIFLNQSLYVTQTLPSFSDHLFSDLKMSQKFYRIGFGKRENGNVRNLFEMTFYAFFEDYLQANDPNGMGGDSGGPVYTLIDNKITLIGVHCGRLVDADGKLLAISYLQLVTQDIQDWILQKINDA